MISELACNHHENATFQRRNFKEINCKDELKSMVEIKSRVEINKYGREPQKYIKDF